MLPRADEIQRAMTGCFAVLRHDPDAMRYFGDDIGAFLRSFFASVLVLPLLVLGSALRGPDAGDLPQMSLSAQMLLYLINWLLWPVAADVAARALGVSNAAYFRYIAAYNWSQLPLTVLLILAGAIVSELQFLALGLSMLYLTFLARAALRITMAMAISLVVLDFALNLVVGLIPFALDAAPPGATPG